MGGAGTGTTKSTDQISERDKTPFLIYESGAPYFIPNSIYSTAGDVITLFEKTGPDEALEQLRKEARNADHSLQHADLNKIWLKYFELFLRPQGKDTPPVAPRLEMLQLMLQRPPCEAWEELRRYLVQNADVLSGWASSFQRVLSERDQISRGDDGFYYQRRDDGSLCQIIGAKTLRETHLDFIMDQALRMYGNLRSPIELFSWFAISADFHENSNSYPKAMKAVLSEPKGQVIQHKWSLQHWDRSRTFKWRPHSNFCDPEWLVADLLGDLTDTLKIDAWHERVQKRLENPTAFAAPYERQMDCVLDCHLRIGDQDEFCFEFSGRPYRWINGSLESDTIISVALKKNEDSLSVEEELNRLLTLLAWGHQISIRRKSGCWIVAAKRSLSWVAGTRSAIGLLLEPRWLFWEGRAQPSTEKWRAMALYREALSSRSVFYEFLNYWKALETTLPDWRRRKIW